MAENKNQGGGNQGGNQGGNKSDSSNRGLASADQETRERVASEGGKASAESRREESEGGNSGSSQGGNSGGSRGGNSGGNRGGNK